MLLLVSEFAVFHAVSKVNEKADREPDDETQPRPVAEIADEKDVEIDADERDEGNERSLEGRGGIVLLEGEEEATGQETGEGECKADRPVELQSEEDGRDRDEDDDRDEKNGDLGR